jgi:hypothetical protein
MSYLFSTEGRAIAQEVSRHLLTAAARVRVQVRSCGFCDGQSDTEAGILRLLRFPLPIRIPPNASQSSSSSSIIRGWYSRQVNSVSPGGRVKVKLSLCLSHSALRHEGGSGG